MPRIATPRPSGPRPRSRIPPTPSPTGAATTTPQGFAPLPPVWRPRQRHAGRYDDDWLARKHPLLPDDFDYRFYQYAAPGLVHEALLAGDEELQLLHMHPDHAHVQVWLPGVRWSSRPRSARTESPRACR